MIDKSQIQELKGSWEPVDKDKIAHKLELLEGLYLEIDDMGLVAAGCQQSLKAYAECYVGIRCMAYFMKDGKIKEQWQKLREECE